MYLDARYGTYKMYLDARYGTYKMYLDARYGAYKMYLDERKEHSKYTGKIVKFIFGFTRITDIDEDNLKLTMRDYNEDVDD